jgi:hypothetical protein
MNTSETDAAVNILYDNELQLRTDFKEQSDTTFQFVDTKLRAHDDVDQTFWDFYKYSYLISSRDSKMEYMTNYNKSQIVKNIRGQLKKLLDHNQRCMRGASVAFTDAMNDYTNYQRVSSARASAPEFNLSWFDRKFGSYAQHAKMVKNVPAGVYLFMVAFTFALLQYEIMFNARCVKLVNLYEANIRVGNPSIVSVPATITMQNKEFYSVFVTGICEWLKVNHVSTDDRIASFMQEIGSNALLDKQFQRTIDTGLQQRFMQRQPQNQNQMERPMSSGRRGRGHGHGSKRPNKRANTRARRMRKTHKRRSCF